MVFWSASYNDFVELCMFNGHVEIFEFGGDHLVGGVGGASQSNSLKGSS
jgi:hypothetical protein